MQFVKFYTRSRVPRVHRQFSFTDCRWHEFKLLKTYWYRRNYISSEISRIRSNRLDLVPQLVEHWTLSTPKLGGGGDSHRGQANVSLARCGHTQRNIAIIYLTIILRRGSDYRAKIFTETWIYTTRKTKMIKKLYNFKNNLYYSSCN
jgi:hypothetical protein